GAGLGVVVAPVEVQRGDVVVQPGGRNSVEGRLQQDEVDAVGAVDGPPDPEAVAIGGDGPLPSAFAPVSGVGAGGLAAVGGLVERPVDGHVVQLEADDPVEGRNGFVAELFEQPSGDPLVTASSEGGIGDLVVEDRFDVDPRGTGDETDQQAPEAQPIRDP